MYTVYKITNKTNGQAYIGVTRRSPEQRLREHARPNHGSLTKLGKAIKEFGADAFEVESLLSTPFLEEAKKSEREHIEMLNTRHEGYNFFAGGEGGFVISPKTRALMAIAKLGDKDCARNFGSYVNKGANSPLSKEYAIECPDGNIVRTRGARAFCREHNVSFCKLFTRGKSKGYKVLERFIDQNLVSYTQAGGNGEYPLGG